jgi:hypothetical protein
MLPFRTFCELLLFMFTSRPINDPILSVAAKISDAELSPIADRVCTYCIARWSSEARSRCGFFTVAFALSLKAERSDLTQNIVVTRDNGSSDSRRPKRRGPGWRYRRRTSSKLLGGC